MKNVYVGDFETNNFEDDCRIWSWGSYNIFKETFVYDNSMESFYNWCTMLPNKSKVYFHNLKFDGEFITDFLFQNGFTHSVEEKLKNKQFNTLITHMGVHYSLKFKMFDKTITFLDSAKLIPLKVKEISGAFGLTQLKEIIDYKVWRAKNYQMTKDEISYLKNDCVIVGKALRFFFDQGLTKTTIASNALFDYKKIFNLDNRKNFDIHFPVLQLDSIFRQSYKGGVTYVKKIVQDVIVKKGLVFDVNSLYPYIMKTMKLPFGEPIFYTGKYKDDKLYNLYIQNIRCSFKVKKDHFPMLQLKHNPRFNDTEYLESSKGEEIILCMTSVELKLFLKHYETGNLEYLRGWKFKSSTQLFKAYVDKWFAVKDEANRTGNKGMKTLAKLMLNSLYGKFGKNPESKAKAPYWNGEQVKYKTDKESTFDDPIYVPIASFITSYARTITVTGAQDNWERFCYTDTDSIHLTGLEPPKGIKVDSNELGAWDNEAVFKEAKFIRAKTYIEKHMIDEKDYQKKKEEDKEGWHFDQEELMYMKDIVTCAGLPDDCKHGLNFENFVKGRSLGTSLKAKRVKGGTVLLDVQFAIKI